MSSYKKLVNNTMIYAIGNFGSKSIAFLMLPFYTLHLSPSEYGKIDLIVTLLGLIIPLLTANIVEAVIRFSVDQKNYTYKNVVSNGLVFWIASILILFLLYPLLIQIDFIKEHIFIFYLLFILQSIYGIIKQFARSINLNIVYVSSDILYTIYLVVFNVVFIYFYDLGVSGYLVSIILATTLDSIFLIKMTMFHKKISFSSLNLRVLKEMIIYCLPLVPNSLMWWIMGISDRYLINFYMGLGATGIYSVATKFPTIVAMFSGVFFKAWQVSAYEEFGKKDNSIFYTNIFNSFFIILSIISSFYLIFNEMFINILVSSNYITVYKYVPFLILGVFFSSLASFTGTNYTVVKKNVGAFRTAIAGALINIILNITLIPLWGLYGAVISTFVSYAVVWILRVIGTKKYLAIDYSYIKITSIVILLIIQATSVLVQDKETLLFINILIFSVICIIGYSTLKVLITKISKPLLKHIKTK